jgi:hypothetical protein
VKLKVERGAEIENQARPALTASEQYRLLE